MDSTPRRWRATSIPKIRIQFLMPTMQRAGANPRVQIRRESARYRPNRSIRQNKKPRNSGA
jgi:hypothetical protein